MTTSDASVTASRGAYLALTEELQVVNDGYEFLDEKRILLAAEMLRQREAYERSAAEVESHFAAATAALAEALHDVGLEGLQTYPTPTAETIDISRSQRAYAGLTLIEANARLDAPPAARQPVRPSPGVEQCRLAFQALTIAAVRHAAVAANVLRLTRDYRRTERRVHALENVVMPELKAGIATMDNLLELIEQEEILRVHQAGNRRETKR